MTGEMFNIDEGLAQETSGFQSLAKLSDHFNPSKARELQRQFAAKNSTDENTIAETEPGVYRVNGALTERIIEQLNSIQDDTTVILDNTAGLSSELISKIKTDRVFFSIKGGLDYDNIEKFNTAEYKKRTEMSPKGLESVVRYFEEVENGMDPKWSDLQKCMYAYNALVIDMKYSYKEYEVDEKYSSRISGEAITRSLNGVNYGELVCAGFALTFKEMMDRIGIECSYQNVPHTHDFNIITIDGKNYGVDVTWDNVRRYKEGNSECSFANFGRMNKEQFYSQRGHGVPEKDRVELNSISQEEINYNQSIIGPRIETREKNFQAIFSTLDDTTRGEYLPIRKESLEADAECSKFIKLGSELTTIGMLDEQNAELMQILQQRKAFVLDMVGGSNFHTHTKTETGKTEYEELIKELSLEKNGMAERNQFKINGLIDSLNSQLRESTLKYITNLYESANEMLENFNMNDQNIIRRTNYYTKLITIHNAREYLVSNGHDRRTIEAICKKIDTALGLNNNQTDIEHTKQTEREFISAAFEGALIDTLRKVDNGEISEEDLISNFSDAEAWASRLTNLNEYNLSNQEIKEIIQKIIDRYQIAQQS